MKFFSLFLTLCCSLVTLNTLAQRVIECSRDQMYWIVSKEDNSFAVQLLGSWHATENLNLISVGDFALQYLIVDATPYRDTDKQDTELKQLSRYILEEANYLSGVYKQKLDVNIQQFEPWEGKHAVLWYFAIPIEAGGSVRAQVFVNLIINNQIVGFGSPQFQDMTFEEVSGFLATTLCTIRSIRSLDDVCKP